MDRLVVIASILTFAPHLGFGERPRHPGNNHRPWYSFHYTATCRSQFPNPGHSGENQGTRPCTIKAQNYIECTFLLLFATGCFHDCCQSAVSDCQQWLDLGHITSGVFNVTPPGTRFGFEVYCDMDTDGGGWLVFQRREDGIEIFYRGWYDYERGFGDVRKDHWLGLAPIKRILGKGHYELRIDLEDWDGQKRYAKYNNFEIGSSKSNYELTVSMYSGDAGDSLERHSGYMFTTKDKDNDGRINENCAELNTGAWWYKDCKRANLNGIYYTGNPTAKNDGIVWFDWKGYTHSLKKTEMKIRQV